MRTDVTVYIVDDDEAVRHSLYLLLQSVGLMAKCCESARAFLEVYDASAPGCMLLDIRMPEMSGLELQRLLNDRLVQIPVIIITLEPPEFLMITMPQEKKSVKKWGPSVRIFYVCFLRNRRCTTGWIACQLL